MFVRFIEEWYLVGAFGGVKCYVLGYIVWVIMEMDLGFLILSLFYLRYRFER